MTNRIRHPLLALAGVVALTVPWLLIRGVGLVPTLPIPVVILLSGVAVIGAAFVLTWGAETAEIDVPRSFALAVLAIIAVAPEYAVDALFASGDTLISQSWVGGGVSTGWYHNGNRCIFGCETKGRTQMEYGPEGVESNTLAPGEYVYVPHRIVS